MAGMTVSGIVSGIDWEGMIAQVIENAQKPAQVQMNKRVNLANKKTLFEEMRELTQNMQSSLTSLRFSSTYRAKTVEMERIDSNGSAKGVLTAKVNADAVAGVYNVEVRQLAKAYTRRSDQITDPDLIGSYVGTTLNFTQNGTKASVTVGPGETLASLATKINDTVKTLDGPLDFTASAVDGRLILKSDFMGRGSVKYTDEITYPYGGNNVITLDDIAVDVDGLASGDLVITDANGKTYEPGVDFDIIGGTQIRWRTHDAGTVGLGDTFTFKYEAAIGDVYKSPKPITRGSGSRDLNVLTFQPDSTATSFTITDEDGFTYAYGTDFTVQGGSIKWLNGGDAPDEGMSYSVEYTAVGGETFDIELSRGDTDTSSIDYANIPAGTVTIEKNDGTILYAGVDFDLEPDSAGKAMVRWRGGSTWLAPSPNETYRVHVASSSGYVYDLGGWSRAASDPLAPADLGFTHAGGTFLPGTVTSGGKTFTSPFSMSVSGGSFMLDWNTSTPTVPRAIPGPGDELTLSYRFDANTFQVDDGGSGLLRAIGLDKTDEEHLTAAQDALVVVDGEEWNLVENELDYENEILNGVKMEFKSVGEVSLEIIHDTEKAVETVDAFVESYNALIQWINVRSSEKQVNTDYSSDESNSFYRSMDEFNTSWGLLYGNSYLRSTKSTLRTIVTQDYPYTFVERVSADPIYGDMAFNGLKRMVRGDGTEEDVTTTLRIKLGSERYANITITSSDTLETIAAKINDEGTDPKTNEAWALHYDEADRYDADGQELSAAELFAKRKSYVKAEVVNNKLVIKTGGSAAAGEEISLSGTDAVNALKMNNSYKGLYQVGIGTTANDYGKSGELEFNSSAFVSALEDRPDEVEKLMMGFAKQMDAQMKTMLTSSGDMSGTLTRQITNIETQISDIDKYLAKFQQRLDDKEEALRRQYAAAEERIAKISEQASSLSGLIAQLSAYKGANTGS